MIYYIFNKFLDKRGGKKKERTSNSFRTTLKKKAIQVKRAEKQPIHNKCFPEKSTAVIEDQENHANSESSEKNNKDEKLSSNEESTSCNTSIEISPPKCEISKFISLLLFIICHYLIISFYS